MLVDEWAGNLVPEAYAFLMQQLDIQLGAGRGLVVASQKPEALQAFPLWLVLDQGTLVEWGPQAAICGAPVHPQTRALLNGKPLVNQGKNEMGGVWTEIEPGHWVRT
jgi:ABC-type protease/lipase transport system fused ATPase/permease subunit